MKVKCHKQIVNDVIEFVNYDFPEDFINGLYRGIVDADSRRNIYTHHHAKSGRDSANFYYFISDYVSEAASSFRLGNYYRAGHELGVAIHIAQDLTLLRGSRGWHNIMERDIEEFLSGEGIDRSFISECVELRDTRLYTISTENIVCKAYAVTARVFDYFLDKVRSEPEEVIINIEFEEGERSVTHASPASKVRVKKRKEESPALLIAAITLLIIILIIMLISST